MNSDSGEYKEPAFEFGDPNQSVLLKKVSASIVIEDITYKGVAEVRLDLLPRAGTHIYTHFEGISPVLILDILFTHKEISSFFLDSQNIPGFIVSIGGNDVKNTAEFIWCPNNEPIIWEINNPTVINKLVFYLFNFREIIGTRRSLETKGNTNYAIEHVDLEANGWSVEFRSLATTHDCFKKLKAKGGYGLTHSGSICKIDKSNFSGDEAINILIALDFFLSFAKGISCNTVCSVGFTNDGKRVWELWNSPMEPWHSPFSWFDEYHCDQLVELFPGFLAKWQDENWHEALQKVIYWYLRANYSPGGVDVGIILAQAAIERLSFEYIVKHKKTKKANEFKELRASEKFRLLFSSLDIPIEIPTFLKNLNKLSRHFNWLDSPHAITEIRNSLVHPENKQHSITSDIYFEAWNLSLWFLELALLRICDYSGSYRNRLVAKAVGQVEDVPLKC